MFKKKWSLQNNIFYILALLIAVGLKQHYSQATSDDLVWILRPTAEIVEQVSGLHFEQEAGTGYINREQNIIIAPSCAGVNFLITAFCMAGFSSLSYFDHRKAKFLWLGASIASAYLLTLLVNTFRIIVAISLYKADLYSSWLTEERAHRIEGIVVYCFFLCFFYLILHYFISHSTNGAKPQKSVENKSSKSKYKHFIYMALVPLFWYFVIILLVPLLNKAYHNNMSRFIEHSGFVLTVGMAVVIVVFLIQVGWDRTRKQ